MISTVSRFTPKQVFLDELKHDLQRQLARDGILPSEIKTSHAVFAVLIQEAKVNVCGNKRLTIAIPGQYRYAFKPRLTIDIPGQDRYAFKPLSDESYHQVTVVPE